MASRVAAKSSSEIRALAIVLPALSSCARMAGGGGALRNISNGES